MSFLSTIKSWFSGSSNTSTASGTKFGVVNYYNRSKGYGFIDTEDMKDRVFLHVSSTGEKLKIGDAVSFTMTKNKKGFIAQDVKKVK